VLAFVHGLVGTGMANVAIPLDECGVGLDDFERVCACGGGHGDRDGKWLDSGLTRLWM
jgi:hypothetical protein